jgi:hypothetical protein
MSGAVTPRFPLALDYRQIPVEHFLIGGFWRGLGKAQRASYEMKVVLVSARDSAPLRVAANL